MLFTLLKVAMIVSVGLLGFSAASGTWRTSPPSFPVRPGGIAGFMAALVAALWAYDGWNDFNMVGGEIRDPGRNIPIALIAGVAIVAGLYMLTNAAVQYVMPAASIAASPRPASEATAIAVGLWGAAIVSAGMALSMLVTLNGTVMSGARVPFALARRLLLQGAGRGASSLPYAIDRAAGATGHVGLSSAVRRQLQTAVLAGHLFEWLFYMITASAVFVLRRKEPNAARPFRTWGYPLVPAIFIVAAAVLLYYTFTQNLRNSAWGVAVILAGVPIYLYFAKKKSNRNWQLGERLVNADGKC